MFLNIGVWRERTEWSDKKLPGKHRACKSWWSRKWQSRCHRFAPRRGCSPTPNHKVSLAGRPAWSPARPLLWRTYHSARKKHPRVRGKAVFPQLIKYRWIYMRSTWRASERLEERFESCCCDWFAFRRPWLFSRKPENTNKINQFLTFPQMCYWRQRGFWLLFEFEEAITCIPITA